MRRALPLAALALLAAGAAWLFVSRGDPAARAAEFARQLARETGRPVTVAGPASFRGWWAPKLTLVKLEIAGIGALENVVLGANGRGSARAELWGRTGAVDFDPARAVFDGEDLRLEFARAVRRLEARTTVAGSPLIATGRAAMGGIADLAVDWAGIAGAGGLDREGGLTLAGDSWRLDGRWTGGAFEGRVTGIDPALGGFEAPLRLDAETLDVADARFAQGRAAIARQGGRWALDLRLGEIELVKAAELLARGSAWLHGDLDLRARASALVWPSGRAEGAILVAGRENGAWALDEAAVRDIAGAALRVTGDTLDLRTADAQRFLAALGVPVDRHLGELVVRGRLDALAARVSPVEIALAGQRLEGALAWHDGRLKAELNGERVDLDPFFLRALPVPARRGPLLTRSQQALAARAAQAPAPGPGGWSRAPLGFDLAGAVPLDLDLRAGALGIAGGELRAARLRAAFGREGIAVEALSGLLFGGKFEAQGALRGGAAPGFSMAYALTGAELGEILAAAGAGPILRGAADLEGGLESGGANLSIWAGNLRGRARARAVSAALEGLDLAGFARRYAQPGAAPDIAELARLAGRGGRTAFDAFDAELRIELGRARVERWRASGGGGTIAGSGLIDVGNWSLDLAAEFAFAGRPAFALAAAGPIPSPRLSFRPAADGAGPPAGSGAGTRAGARPASR